MNKAENLLAEDSCLNKAKADEPIFIIRAKDVCSSMTVRLWADMAEAKHGKEKAESARKLADEMDIWRKSNCKVIAEERPWRE